MSNQSAVLVIGAANGESERVREWIEEAGHDGIVADDWRSGLRELYSCHPDAAVVFMDAMDASHWSNVERIRELCDIPIVLVTSQITHSAVQRAFDLGLNGYLVKPLQPEELASRLSVVLQKVSNNGGNHSGVSTAFRHENLTIDWRKMEVQVDGDIVHLSPTEFKLLSLLVERRGWVVSYDEILIKVWGSAYLADRNNVKLYVWYLRQKLEGDPANPRWILTKYGVGYTFCADEVRSSL